MTPAAVLLVRARDVTCALPLEAVRETMRPLPCKALPAVPAFVRGASVVRGAPTPVVDLGALLGQTQLDCPTRYVLLAAPTPVVLVVDEVMGLHALPLERGELPRLLRDAGVEHLSDLQRLDAELVPVLRSALVLPQTVLGALRAEADADAADAP